MPRLRVSALAHSWQMFTLARFATGFGVGGEFAAGASLVTDVMPAKARGPALTILQASSALGNILAAAMLGITSHYFDTHLAWRYLYLIGAMPALLAVFVMSWMKEPEKWVKARADARISGELKKFGSLKDLFAHPRWRRNALVGLALAVSGVIGLWGIGFYSPELIDSTFPQMSEVTGQRLTPLVANLNTATAPAQIKALDDAGTQALRDLLSRVALRDQKFEGDLSGVAVTASQQQKMIALLAKRMTPSQRDSLKSHALILQQCGAFFGMLTAGILAIRIGRRITFALSFAAAWAAIVIVFLNFQQPSQIWTLYPFLGFCTLLPFGAYAIYFPEIFPTRLRSTGTGFCYNVGRYIAAFGPPLLVLLRNHLIGRFEIPAFRAAAVIVSSIFVIGIIAAFLGPKPRVSRCRKIEANDVSHANH